MQEIKEIVYGKIFSRDLLHFTGGVRGFKVPEGWVVGPILVGGVVKYIGPLEDVVLSKVASELAVEIIGGEEEFEPDSGLKMRIWHSLLVERVASFSVAEVWGFIASESGMAGDEDFSVVAKSIALSLQAADIRLRDISDEYHCQLTASLKCGRSADLKFSNIRIFDLHVAFHSFIAELGSARDYICKVIAKKLGAPDRIDSYSRIIDWVKNKKDLHSNNFVAEIMKRKDGCLYFLGEYRNTFLHRQPVGVYSGGFDLRLSSSSCAFGDVLRVNMPIPSLADGGEVDALDIFISIYKDFLQFARVVALGCGYSIQPRSFYVRR